jgi:hypothetical protein
MSTDQTLATEDQQQVAYEAGWEHFYSGAVYANPYPTGPLFIAFHVGYLAAKRCARECRDAGVGA